MNNKVNFTASNFDDIPREKLLGIPVKVNGVKIGHVIGTSGETITLGLGDAMTVIQGKYTRYEAGILNIIYEIGKEISFEF